jgi:hypothetical protein
MEKARENFELVVRSERRGSTTTSRTWTQHPDRDSVSIRR